MPSPDEIDWTAFADQVKRACVRYSETAISEEEFRLIMLHALLRARVAKPERGAA